MKRIILPFLCAASILTAASCNDNSTDCIDVQQENITHLEPPCWWTGMKTNLVLMVNGPQIGSYDISIQGLKGVKVSKVETADSPNYAFVSVDIAPNAQTGTAYLVFKRGDEKFKYPYTISARKEGSAMRESFSTKDAIYLLMPDRFRNGDPSNDNTDDTSEKADVSAFFGRHGGDIQGIIDRLDYIADLGFTAIWTCPILEDNEPRESYHGYACTNYYKVDSRFGGNEMYRTMISEAHKRGIKIILDVVTNHSGDAHWWYSDLPFEDWIHQWPVYTHSNCVFSAQNDPYCSEHDRKCMQEGWFDTSMVDMNLDNPHLLQYFKQWAVWWIEWAGLDGFRVDTYPYNEKVPMAEWCQAVLDEYPNFNIVGEVWSNNVPQVAYWQADNPNKDGFNSHLPSIMDFPLYNAICQSINVDHENWNNGITLVYDSIANDYYYQDVSNMMIFMGNHDTDHMGDIVNRDPAKMKLIYALMATLRGFPQIFSGDELMLSASDRSQGDGGRRVELPDNWESDPIMKDVHDYFKALFQWRKTSAAVHDGKTVHFLSRDNTYAYFRILEDELVFVYANNNAEQRTIPWADYAEVKAPCQGRNVVTGQTVDFSLPVSVGPKEALVVEFKKNE